MSSNLPLVFALWLLGGHAFAESLQVPGFVPPRLKSSDIPISTCPTTFEEINDLTEKSGWGLVTTEVLHNELSGTGGLLFEDKPVGVELPHADWARPWAGGPVKALVFTSPVMARQVVELAHRLDGEVTTSFFPSTPYSSWEQTPGNNEVLERMVLDRLFRRNPDVLLVSHVWRESVLAPKVWPEVRRRVENGMGLVLMLPEGRSAKDEAAAAQLPADSWAIPNLVHITTESHFKAKTLDWVAFGDPHFTWWGLPYGAMGKIVVPAIQFVGEGWATLAKVGDQPWILTKEIGKGRVVVLLNFGDLLPFAEREDWRMGDQAPWRPSRENRQLDHRTAVVLKSLLWAARKDTGVLLKAEFPPVVPWKESFALKAVVSSGPLHGHGKLHVSVQDDDYRVVFAGEASCELKEGSDAEFQLPALGRNGRYFADVVLRDGAGRSLNWHSVPLSVVDGLKIAVKPQKEIYRKHETLLASVTIEGVAAGYLPFTLEGELWDRFGRLIAKASRECKEPAAANQGLRFETPLADCLSPVMMLVGRARSKGKEIARAEAEITMPSFGLEDDHRLIAWPPYQGERRGLHLQLARRLGFDTCTIGPWGPPVQDARRAAWAGLGLFIENANHLATCLNDRYFPGGGQEYDEYRDKTCQPCAEQVLRRYGLRLLSMSNEATFYKGTPADKRVITPVQEAAFRTHLKEVYADIASLNQEWETDFKSFEEIKPLPYGTKPASANFPRFVDWDLFLQHVSVEEQKKSLEIYFGAMGGSCPWGSTSGGNTEQQFAAGATLHGSTMGDGKMPHTIGTPNWFDLTRGGTAFTWVGYSYPEWKYNYFPWYNVLHGSKTDAVFTSGNAVNQAGAITGRGLWHLQYEADIRNGIGKLLATSKRRNDPVAVFHSDLAHRVVEYFASMQSGDRYAGQFYGRFRDASYRGFVQLLLDSQLHPTFVTASDLEAGKLAEMKMLFLCGSVAMSEKSAEAIRHFADAGGIVVADLAPATFDEHGKMLPQGRLDDFFGFRRGSLKMTSYPAEYTLGILKDTNSPYLLPKEWFWVELREDDIKATDGQALGQHIVGSEPPAFIFKQHGKGASLYLNYLDTQYTKTRDLRHLNFMTWLLKWADIKPRVQVTDGHVPLSQFDVTYFVDEQAIHAGIDRDQRDIRTPDKVVVNFPGDGHAYDVREGTYLGQGRSFEVEVPQAKQKLVSLLPCRIDGITLKLPKAVSRGAAMEFSVSPSLAGKETSLVYRITVMGPEGEASEAYSSKVRTAAGKASFSARIPTALNDALGAWTLEVTEVVSGRSAKATFRVK